MNNLFADILIKLVDAKVKYILAGGVASVLHGVERLTFDIDLALEMKSENLERFFKVAKELNFKPRVAVDLEFLLVTITDPKLPIKQIDIFLTPENSYQNLIKDTIVVDIKDREVTIVSINKLIEMKKNAGREKDLLDIRELNKILNDN